MDYPLNNEEVAKIAGKPITMIPYTDIHYYDDIDDLFATDHVLLNYLTTSDFGHWVGLRKDKNKITFFDSYGKMPDDQLEYIPMKFRIESNQDYPYLVELLKKWVDSNKKHSVHYCNEQLQRYSSRIQTCGRWVGLFFKYDMPIEKFEKTLLTFRDRYAKANKLSTSDKNLLLDRLSVLLTDEYVDDLGQIV